MSELCKECNFRGVDIAHYPCNECCEIICIGTEKFPNHFEPISEERPYNDITDRCITAETPVNNVEHPAHYTGTSIECIDAMRETQGVEAVKNFCICNAFKYLWRHDRKNGVEDVKKAAWYLNKFIELEEKKTKTNWNGRHRSQLVKMKDGKFVTID